VTKAGKPPGGADSHSSALLGAGGVMVAAGAAFMALAPSKATKSFWANSWFDVGFACLIIGLILAARGFYLNYRRQKPAPTVVTETKLVMKTARLRSPRPPLVVQILPDSGFERWNHSAMIATLQVAIENTTSKDILIDGYEFTYGRAGQLAWDHQATDDEQISTLQEIKRREQSLDHSQSLRELRRISAGDRISRRLLKSIPRNPAGGTPECTVAIIDDVGNKYTAKLSGQEPRTYDP